MRLSQCFASRAAIVALISVAGCGGGSGGYPTGSGNLPPGGQQPPTTTASIIVRNNRFTPASATVAVGTTVTWTWDACDDDGYGGTSCTSHNVTFDASGGGSTTQSTGSYSRQFNSGGTFNYRCSVHGASMTGQVIVR